MPRSADPLHASGPRRGARWLASAATLGTFAAVAVAALQLVVGWRAQNATVRASMERYAAYAAKTTGDAMRRRFADLGYRTLAPLIGARATVDAAPPTLDRLAQFATVATGEAEALHADDRLGFYRIDHGDAAGTSVATLPIGTRATPAMLRTVAIAARPRFLRYADLATTNATTHRVDGEMLVSVSAWLHAADGRPIALYGVVRRLELFVADAARLNHRWTMLLPPLDYGSSLPPPDARDLNERYLALRVRLADGPVLYTSDNWTRGDLAASPFRATYRSSLASEDGEPGDLVVEAVLDPSLRRLVENSVATRLTRMLLVAVLLVAIALAVVALAGHRRQRELARARERFVAAVSHELRTPLAQVRMFSELLSNDMVRSPEQARRWLGVIHREAIRLGALVENVLLFARGQATEMRVSPRDADAVLLARDALGAFAPVADGRRVVLRAELPESAPVWADPDAVRQVIGNLLDNAVKYGPEGQTVTLRIRQRDGETGEVAIAVDDEGGGVPRADRERIWQRFTRLHHDGTTGGSGLGLSLVRELVDKMGGRTWVEAAPGGGARFVVTLPAG